MFRTTSKYSKTALIIGLLLILTSITLVLSVPNVSAQQAKEPSAAEKEKAKKEPAKAPTLGRDVKNIGGDTCGNDGSTQVKTKFNFGCLGDSYPGNSLSPIEDGMYAIIRFLSAGVGVAVVISIIMAGIKYSASEGNPETTQAAKDRVRSTLIALLLYIFAFSLIQYLVPGGVFS